MAELLCTQDPPTQIVGFRPPRPGEAYVRVFIDLEPGEARALVDHVINTGVTVASLYPEALLARQDTDNSVEVIYDRNSNPFGESSAHRIGKRCEQQTLEILSRIAG